MRALRELQFAFGDALLGGAHGAPCGYVLLHVHGNGLTAAQRVAIYGNNFREILVGALRATFPAVEKIVGERFFRAAAERHARAYPSTSGDVRRYGDGFAHFLGHFEPAANLPYLSDVARLEWAWNESFNAPEPTRGLDLAALAQVPREQWEGLSFTLHPSARLVASIYPVLRIWQMNQDGARDDARVSLDEGGVHLLLLRFEGEVRIHRIDLAEHTFLAALQRGEPLSDALERAYEADEGFALGRVLQEHIALGTFASWQDGAPHEPPVGRAMRATDH
jgi:hypothetical protein